MGCSTMANTVEQIEARFDQTIWTDGSSGWDLGKAIEL